MELSQQIGGEEAGLSDEQAQAASADEEFAALVRRQSHLVFRVAYSVLRNVQDSEDVAQEVFLKLFRTGRWRVIEDEAAFLARAGWRMAVDRRRTSSAQSKEQEVACQQATPEQAASESDWIAHVHQLMDALPRELREPLVLASVEELNSAQIGQILGIPEGTVRNRLHRARQMLKEKLAARMGGAHGR